MFLQNLFLFSKSKVVQHIGFWPSFPFFYFIVFLEEKKKKKGENIWALSFSNFLYGENGGGKKEWWSGDLQRTLHLKSRKSQFASKRKSQRTDSLSFHLSTVQCWHVGHPQSTSTARFTTSLTLKKGSGAHLFPRNRLIFLLYLASYVTFLSYAVFRRWISLRCVPYRSQRCGSGEDVGLRSSRGVLNLFYISF